MTRSTAAPTRPGGRAAWLFVLPALVALLVSLPALTGPFVSDDTPLIVEDAFVHDLANAPAAFGRAFFAGAGFGVTKYDYYRPVTTVTFMLNYAWTREAAWSYHLVNSLLYALTAGLVALLCAGLGMGAGTALAAGLLFAAWPAHHENVDFIAGRTDVLAALFMVLAAFALRRSRERGGAAPLAGLALAGALAALSKEIAYLLPAGVVCWEWAAGWRRDSGARAWAAALPVALALPLRQAALAGQAHLRLPEFGFIASTVLVNTRILMAPWPPHVLRYVPYQAGKTHWALVALWVAFVAGGAALLPRRAERVAWLFGWGILVPGSFTGTPADRMIYLPSLILLPLAAWRLSRLPAPPRALGALCAGVVALGGVQFALCARLWQDDVAIFEEQVRQTPGDHEAHDELADGYYTAATRTGAPDSTHQRLLAFSWRETRRSLELDPTRAATWYSAARTLNQLGRSEDAVGAARAGLRLREEPAARRIEVEALLHLGRIPEAAAAAESCVASAAGAGDAESWATAGWVRYLEGRYAASVAASSRALELSPGLRYAAFNRALARLGAGQADTAIAEYRSLLRGPSPPGVVRGALDDLLQYEHRGGPGGAEALWAFLEAAGSLPKEAAQAPASARAALAERTARAALSPPPGGG